MKTAIVVRGFFHLSIMFRTDKVNCRVDGAVLELEFNYCFSLTKTSLLRFVLTVVRY